MSLYKKYRPQSLNEMFGCEDAKNILINKIETRTLPQCILMAGPSGSGKTTIARIIAKELESNEVKELNCADVRGIDTVREIKESMRYKPLSGKYRVWIMDEVVQFPTATQQAFLKELEDTPPADYFIFCASETKGLIPTFLSRCFTIKLSALSDESIGKILKFVLAQEERKIMSTVGAGIVNLAGGNARKALNLLEAALSTDDTQEQLAVIDQASIVEPEKVEFLAIALLKRRPWSEIAKIVDSLEDKQIEGLRRQVLAYFTTMMLKLPDKAAFAHVIMTYFSLPWLDTPKSSLVMACYSLCSLSRK